MRVPCDARSGSFLLLLLAAALLPGCTHTGQTSGMAANLTAPDDMPTLRNVADPNAPYTLRPSPPALVARPAAAMSMDAGAAPICDESQLSLFETRSRINGPHHSLQLTLENQGAQCRLQGFASVTLLDPEGAAVEDVTFERVSAAAMSATVGRAATAAAGTTAPAVLLGAHSDAVFEIGWTSGAQCRAVSRIAVAAPGSTAVAYIPRQMQLCGDRILITAVAPGGMD